VKTVHIKRNFVRVQKFFYTP